jgi:hypothetical protein
LVPPTKIICECLQVADLTPPPPAVPDPFRPFECRSRTSASGVSQRRTGLKVRHPLGKRRRDCAVCGIALRAGAAEACNLDGGLLAWAAEVDATIVVAAAR